jgi:hypothetical protein
MLGMRVLLENSALRASGNANSVRSANQVERWPLQVPCLSAFPLSQRDLLSEQAAALRQKQAFA